MRIDDDTNDGMIHLKVKPTGEYQWNKTIEIHFTALLIGILAMIFMIQ